MIVDFDKLIDKCPVCGSEYLEYVFKRNADTSLDSHILCTDCSSTDYQLQWIKALKKLKKLN